MKQVLFGKHLRYLVPSELESALLGAAFYTKLASGWSSTAKKFGVLIDLSKVEWVDLGSALQLVLIVESAAREGIRVDLALPYSRARQSEKLWMEKTNVPGAVDNTLRRIERRTAARNFLQYIRFEEALQLDHLGGMGSKINLLSDFDSSLIANEIAEDSFNSVAGNIPAGDYDHLHNEELYKYFFPLTWVSPDKVHKTREMAKFLSGIVGEPERGLERLDADTIANVIFYELIENIAQHAQTSWALVAGWARPSSVPTNPLHCLRGEQPYVSWSNASSTSVVELVIGDSGRGIPNSLMENFRRATKEDEILPTEGSHEIENILLWAFERWSTSKNRSSLRGTRGLYRVDRIVKKYQGLVTARAENYLAGWDHGGFSHDRPVFAEQKLSFAPGTMFRLRIPSFHEQTPVRVSATKADEEFQVRFLTLGQITAAGIESTNRTMLQEALNLGRTDKPVCVVASVEGGEEEQKAIEETLRQAVEMRHPSTLVISGLPGGWDLIENAVDSINLENERERHYLEAHDSRNFQIWDPVLVIGPRMSIAWVGATTSHRIVLNKLIGFGGSISADEISQVLPQREFGSVLRYLRNDTNLIKISDDGKTIHLRFTPTDLLTKSTQLLADHISQSKTGVMANVAEVYRVPSLLLVTKWLNVESILAATNTLTVAMLALTLRILECDSLDQIQLLCDSTVSSTHVNTLGMVLRAHGKETIPGESGPPMAPGVHVVERGSRVIVYCDVIVSGESVKRCIRQVLRDEATPILVACLIDARQDPTQPIDMVVTKIPVVSVLPVSIIADAVPMNAKEVFINPITRYRERDSNEVTYPIEKDTDLRELIVKNNALHFRHIGRPIGRHFTFYLDDTRLIHEPAIAAAVNREVDRFLRLQNGTGSEGVEVWYPSPEPKTATPAFQYAELIVKGRRRTSTRRISREPAHGYWYFPESQESSVRFKNVVVVDWGSVTGTTVMQMIRLATEAGAERVLVCVIFSQLPPIEEAFLSSLGTMRIEKQAKLTQPDLFEGRNHQVQKLKVSKRTPELYVRFLTRVPITAYDSHDCPVCQQLTRISQETYPTVVLESFARDQELSRLRMSEREDIVRTDPEDINGRPLPGSSAAWMLYFRGKLMKALGSTRTRHLILEELKTLASNFLDTHTHQEEVLSLLHFLSIETQWLRKPPLHLKSVHDIVTVLAFEVAVNRQIPKGDRLNAVIVLRTHAKFTFASKFEDLIRSAADPDDDSLLKQLLYDAFTYTVRPYHQSASVFEPFAKSLEAIVGAIKQGKLKTSDEVFETVELLLSRAKVGFERAQYRQLTPPQAWMELRRILFDYKPHRAAVEGITRILSEINVFSDEIERLLALEEKNRNRSRDLTVSWLKRLNANWLGPRDFLGNTLFQLLPSIRVILQSEEGRNKLGFEATKILVELIDADISLHEAEISRLIKRVSDNPKEILLRKNWENLKWYMHWFWEILLKPKGIDESAAKLIEFVDLAPTNIGETIIAVYNEMKETLPPHEPDGLEQILARDYQAFCTAGLLSDAFGQLLSNVKKHWTKSNEPLRIHFEIGAREDRVSLYVWNNMTKEKPADERGIGLESIRARLQPFKADLKIHSRLASDWATYKVELIFERLGE